VRTPIRIVVGCLALLALSLTAQSAQAGYTFRLIADDGVPNASAGEAQLHMTAEAVGSSQVRFRFTNTSSDPDPVDMSITSVYFDDRGFFTGGAVTGGTGTFAPVTPESFPDGGNLDPDFMTTFQFSSEASEGVTVGGFLDLTFTLASGQRFQDVLEALEAGAALEGEDNPAGTLRVGLFVQNFEGTDQGGASFLNEGSDGLDPVPAPAGLVLLATAIPVFGLRRLLRRKTA
jgi:hypothetical protein